MDEHQYDDFQPKREFDPLAHETELDWETYRAPMKPSIDETVGLTSPGNWTIGSSMLCKACNDKQQPPPEAVCSWTDNGTMYYLQKRQVPKEDLEPEGNFLIGRLADYEGPFRSVWSLSPNVFIKVKPWTKDLTTEATTIRWVNKHVPSLPTEDVIYDWIDTKWFRTVMISRRVPGVTYQEAWPSLSTQQKLQVADQVAEHLKALGQFTSDYIETVAGTGLAGKHSLGVAEALSPTKLRVLPRVSRKDHIDYMTRLDSGITPLCADEPLVLQHNDVNPTNFLITKPSSPQEIPKVTGIIDWENIGYKLKWETSTFARQSTSFWVHTDPPHPERNDWGWMLSNACVRAGFPIYLGLIRREARLRYPDYPDTPVEYLYNSTNMPIIGKNGLPPTFGRNQLNCSIIPRIH
ncbi:hypothetical protein G7Y89_g9441 [Cudoniella acicularis]|uniref:Aminoglycoside phosphotransferase domain-containing protein n=1 Tax=Cudoniella acicularis TaxID=354080 RepID=A0A8H4W2L2_9HELO|nr:hypothetical protein G7Y89_g9441 [Cudoniella acicularis]